MHAYQYIRRLGIKARYVTGANVIVAGKNRRDAVERPNDVLLAGSLSLSLPVFFSSFCPIVRARLPREYTEPPCFSLRKTTNNFLKRAQARKSVVEKRRGRGGDTEILGEPPARRKCAHYARRFVDSAISGNVQFIKCLQDFHGLTIAR